MTQRKKDKNVPSLNFPPPPTKTNTIVDNAQALQVEIDKFKMSGQELKYNDFELHETIGKGQYGEVKRVKYKPTQQIMAMKILSMASGESSKNQLLKELEVLRESKSPYIVSFYGAFFQEGLVYYCMEFMEYGSLDKLYNGGVPEIVLAKIAIAMIEGLKYMKEVMNKMHRDVKPTNVLANTRGEIKLCDFGIVAELQQSIASSYIGCSMYMAPERINTNESSQGYGVYSDVWSLGISLIEIAHGVFPYPQQKNVFDQLNAIVNGDAPQLNPKFSKQAQDFVARCLQKVAKSRPTYAELLDHEWIKMYRDQSFDLAEWMKTVAQKNKKEKN